MSIQPSSLWVKWSVAVAACTLLVACHKKQPAVPSPSPQAAPPVIAATPPPPPPRVSPTPQAPAPPALTEEQVFARLSLADLNASTPLDDTFFEYDRWDLSEPGRSALQRNADWMRKWTSTRVTVQGHADERGTNEYNLALGERRAAITRDYLVSLGIEPARIAIVSKGREAPFCFEQNEGCWSQNRRGHFIITGK